MKDYERLEIESYNSLIALREYMDIRQLKSTVAFG